MQQCGHVAFRPGGGRCHREPSGYGEPSPDGFGLGIVDFLQLYNPVTDQDGLLCFLLGTPNAHPSPIALQGAAQEWISQAAEDGVGFYTAPEEEEDFKSLPLQLSKEPPRSQQRG